MNPTDFSDPLTFHLASPAGQTFHLTNKISQHRTDGLSLYLIQTFMSPSGWIVTTFCDPLAFHLAPSSGQDLNNTFV